MTPEVVVKLQTTRHLGSTLNYKPGSNIVLGLPYTNCVDDRNYSKAFCEFTAMMTHIAHVCDCVPEFAPNVLLRENYTRSCNFYEYGTCVSYVRSYFDINTVGCMPACSTSEYVTSSIQVSCMLYY